MRVFVPYTEISDATEVALRFRPWEEVEMVGEYGYGDYFRERWAAGESFINVEHDCVPWPGALEALEDCPEMWCAYDYILSTWGVNEGVRISVPLGCMKITDRLMQRTSGIWNDPVAWSYCDSHLYREASKVATPHQHFPGITNANKELKKLRVR